MIRCSKCQSENPEDSRFCSKCAAPLKPSSEKSLEFTETLRIPTEGLTSGSVLAGKYRIHRKLGRGGMGVVYEAEDIKLKRTVALKFLPRELTYDGEARERFIHEAQAASALDHPHICTIHEIDEAESGQMYIAMACYRGESLKEKIRRGPLEIKESVEIAAQVADGLAKAHEQGIVHRDIKPANILITEDGLAKIVDFGLAKLAGEARLTRPGTALGTVAYMSPEQLRGETVEAKTDIWSMGVVLYEMITGQLPFGGESQESFIYSIIHRDPRPVKDLQKNVPLELEDILRKTLAKDPKKRFASGREMAAALQELKLKIITASYPTTRKLTFRKPRKRLVVGAGIGAFLAIAVLVLWMTTRPSLAFENRDKLLVADVDNQTGDEVFNLALRTAIEAALQQSPYANVFDKGEVAETLRLMKTSPSSRIDERLGCEICRFSGVRALILPRILSAGEAFELQAILIDPVRNRHVDRIRVTARGKEQVLLEAIDKLSRQMRSRLGETLKSIEKAQKPVVQVATSSWEALNYFSMGQVKWNEGKSKDAAALFELALEKDPHFVSARGSLGLVLIQFLGQKEKGKEMLRQALADAKDLPQDEYLGIKAVHRQYVDEDLPGALDEYRMMSQIYPDSMRAYNNSGIILRALGRFDEAVAMFEKAAKVAPRNSVPLSNLWWTQLRFRKDPDAAEEAGRKLVKLGPGIAFYRHALGYGLVAQARLEEAIEEYRQTVSIEPEHPYGLPNLAHLLHATGKAAESVPFYRKVRDLVQQGRMTGMYAWTCFDLALALAESGDREAAKKVAAEGREALLKALKRPSPNVEDLILLGHLEAAAGRIDEARQYLKRALALGVKDTGTSVQLAELYALTGQKDPAIETLRKTLAAGLPDPFFPLIIPAFQSIRNDPQFRALFKFEAK